MHRAGISVGSARLSIKALGGVEAELAVIIFIRETYLSQRRSKTNAWVLNTVVNFGCLLKIMAEEQL